MKTYLETLRRGPPGVGTIGDWQERHKVAVRACERMVSPHRDQPTLERSTGMLIAAWAGYADAHRLAYASGIGEDSVLGPEWASIGRALLGLLTGDLGRMDGGVLDAFLRASLEAEDVGTEED